MNKAGNTYWVNSRFTAQRTLARELVPPYLGESLTGYLGARPVARRRSFAIPAWVVFTMVLVAFFAMGVTVSIRTRLEMVRAAEKYSSMTQQVEQLKQHNAALRQQVIDLESNPRAIEAAARARLNMVRPHEIVVPVD